MIIGWYKVDTWFGRLPARPPHILNQFCKHQKWKNWLSHSLEGREGHSYRVMFLTSSYIQVANQVFRVSWGKEDEYVVAESCKNTGYFNVMKLASDV